MLETLLMDKKKTSLNKGWTYLPNQGPSSYLSLLSKLNEKVYVYGGVFVEEGVSKRLPVLWEHDLLDGSWSRKSDGPVGIQGGIGVATSDGFITYSGNEYESGGLTTLGPTNKMRKWLSSTDSWAELSAITPEPGNRYTSAYTNDGLTEELYIYGNNTNTSRDLWIYNPKTHSWSNPPGYGTAPGTGANSSCFLAEDYFWKTGGFHSTNGPIADIMRWKRSSKTWEKFTNLPIPIYGHAMEIMADYMYIFGGFTTGNVINGRFFRINITNFQVEELEPPATPAVYSKSFVYENSIYFLGGFRDGTPTNQYSVYTP